ncbi:MAG: alpha/beta hydrolase [Candidatus Tectomicrobia bacterium]
MPDKTTMLDHPIVSSRYFYPRPASIPEPYWVDAADGSKLACAYREVHPEAKTVVYFHGNGEVVADYLPDFPPWMARAGYNLLLAEYRGYGMSTGRPALAGMLADVASIIASLHQPEGQIVFFGRSLGSLYALHGAYEHPHSAGLILESGISDITERFFQRVHPDELGASQADLVAALHQHFDYAKKLKTFKGNTLIMHTRFDELVPVRHAERLYAAALEPKQLHIFDQGGHNDILSRNWEAYTQLVETFIAAL